MTSHFFPATVIPIEGALLFALFTRGGRAPFPLSVCTPLTFEPNESSQDITVFTDCGLKKTSKHITISQILFSIHAYVFFIDIMLKNKNFIQTLSDNEIYFHITICTLKFLSK